MLSFFESFGIRGVIAFSVIEIAGIKQRLLNLLTLRASQLTDSFIEMVCALFQSCVKVLLLASTSTFPTSCQS